MRGSIFKGCVYYTNCLEKFSSGIPSWGKFLRQLVICVDSSMKISSDFKTDAYFNNENKRPLEHNESL